MHSKSFLQTSVAEQPAISSFEPVPDPIPVHLCHAFAPATHYVCEWKDYWLECPGADRLRVGTERIKPKARDLFLLRFENQLGLTSIQPFAGERPLCPPIYIEVLSPKFPSPDAHLRFFRTLLDDLFARAARLPFTIRGPTGRGVREVPRPPTPLFTFHFLCQHAPRLRTALTIIQAMPHRQLRDHPAFVPLTEVAEADADVLLFILHTPREWVPASGFPLAERLQGHAPTRVWQRRPVETTDTPENRFVQHFLRQVLTAAEALPDQRWWLKVPSERRVLVRETICLLRQALVHPMFDEVGPLQRLPLNSQVLLRREGYRDLLGLWQRFHQARRPLFEPLQEAIEVRDIATLYEIWVFFALIEEIATQVKESPAVDFHFSEEKGMEWEAWARFGRMGTLVYNRGWRKRSYSVPLRPDFTWMQGGEPQVVLDAKFRLERRDLEGVEEEEESKPEAVARRTDLYKMHTYCDALGVRAAVAVYPGDETLFYDRARGRRRSMALKEVLLGDLEGIGALAMSPGNMTTNPSG